MVDHRKNGNMNIVLYTQRVEIVSSYNEHRDCIDQKIPLFIHSCGYLPIAVPNNREISSTIFNELGKKIVGIILTGGNSLVKYGGNAKERDDNEAMIIQYANNYGIPIYGICRGMQILLDYYGVTLSKVDNHITEKHSVECAENTYGFHIDANNNSYHNYGCYVKDIEHNKVIESIAYSSDNVLEAIYVPKYKALATMWHPERYEVFRKSDKYNLIKLFKRE